MRQRIRLVPQDAVPTNPDIGIHLQPIGAPVDPDAPAEPDGGDSPTCVPTCGGGWGVTINDAPSTGDVHHFLDAAFVAVIVPLDVVELCGGCLEWELRQLSAESEELQLEDISVETTDCSGATVTGAGDVSYEGLWFGAYPTLNGEPYCQPVLFRSFTDCTTVIGPGATNTYFTLDTDGSAIPYGPDFDLAGNITSGAGVGGPPRIIITGVEICPGTTVTFTISQDAGTFGNGEGMSILNPLPSGAWELTFATLFDLTDSVFTVTPVVNGVPYTDQNITFTCDNT